MTDTLLSTGHTVLKVLVGSHAHGLAGLGSDRDIRRVYVRPTTEMFRLRFKPPGTHWAKSGEDETAWEVGPFLSLAVQCHPLVLETLVAPTIAIDRWGAELQKLFPAIWSPQQAYDAFIGYGLNQRTKFLQKKDGRPAKYAATYIRVLYHLCELLETGTFTLRIVDTPIGAVVAKLKDGAFRTGEVIDLAEHWTDQATRRLADCNHEPDLAAVDDFLIRLRKAFLG
ncbi:nucleotidyltransferase domain-containing protein [Nitrospira sp. Nam74]